MNRINIFKNSNALGIEMFIIIYVSKKHDCSSIFSEFRRSTLFLLSFCNVNFIIVFTLILYTISPAVHSHHHWSGTAETHSAHNSTRAEIWMRHGGKHIFIDHKFLLPH